MERSNLQSILFWDKQQNMSFNTSKVSMWSVRNSVIARVHNSRSYVCTCLCSFGQGVNSCPQQQCFHNKGVSTRQDVTVQETGKQHCSNQGHPTDRFGGISVRKTSNRLKFLVREISSRAFLINFFCFRRDKNAVLGTKIGQLEFSERQ